MQEILTERRSGTERRQQRLAAFWHGSLRPRRRGGRRMEDRYAVVDWYSPRVLAIVVAIMALCVLDGVLTLLLLSHGAVEVNPLMALLVPASPRLFAIVKLTLTGIGMCVLAACSRMRLFRTISGESVLYLVLASYVLLIVHELRLVSHIQTAL